MASKKKTQAAVINPEDGNSNERWFYEADEERFTVYDENRIQVCTVASEKDARLIAKAPELLEELTCLVMSFPEFESDEDLDGSDVIGYLGEHHYGRRQIIEDCVGKKLVIGEDRNYVFRSY